MESVVVYFGSRPANFSFFTDWISAVKTKIRSERVGNNCVFFEVEINGCVSWKKRLFVFSSNPDLLAGVYLSWREN